MSLLALIATSTTAAPVLDMFADPCTGSGQMKANMAGLCYSGGATVLALSETAIVKVISYDDATKEGSIRVDTEGASVMHCGPAAFKKSSLDGQINADLAGCGKLQKALASTQYCSDQDTMCATRHSNPRRPTPDRAAWLPDYKRRMAITQAVHRVLAQPHPREGPRPLLHPWSRLDAAAPGHTEAHAVQRRAREHEGW